MPRKQPIIPPTAEQRLDVVAELFAKALYRLRHGGQVGSIHRLVSAPPPKKKMKKDLQSSPNGASMQLHGGRT